MDASPERLYHLDESKELMMPVPLKVFCCYAREDKDMLEHLKKHLMPLQRNGQISVWSDTDLNAGVEWEKELYLHLESADIILLLISPDFMASDYCYSTEMRCAIERHDQGKAHVIPILLRPVYWKEAPFSTLQMLPTNTNPITSWSNWDEAWSNVVIGILDSFKGLLSSQRSNMLSASKSNGGHVKPHAKKSFPISPLSFRSLLSLLVCCILLIAGGTFVFLRWSFPRSAPQPTITSTQVSHSASPVGLLLYVAQWSQGSDLWSLSRHCTWSANAGGEIKTDGGNGNDVLAAPYTLHVANYAIKASIKRIGYTHLGGDTFGLIVRNNPQVGGYIAGIGAHLPPEHAFIGIMTRSGDNGSEYVSSDLSRAYEQLDDQWHTYLLEVRGPNLTFFLDGVNVSHSENSMYTQAGNVGIYIDSASLEIRSFKIMALS